jgi:5-methylcytosine-specific restriction endonuclease McrA
MLKRCKKCGFEKDTVNFYHRKESKGSYQSWCKKCVSKRHKEYYEENKRKITKHHKEYNRENKEKIIKYKKEYCEENKKKINAYMREYRQTPNGKILSARAEKKYKQSEKGKIDMKRKNHKHRVRMNSTEATLTLEQWTQIIKMQNNTCNICKQKFTKKRVATTDHIIPLSKGGGLTFENVQALCGSCNSSKNAKLDPGFIQTWSHR